MAKEPRTDRTIRSAIRRQACELVAIDFMEKNNEAIALCLMKRQRIKNAIALCLMKRQRIKNMPREEIISWLEGHQDGFATCLELILSGKLNVRLVETEGG
jgi:hypothetical protein